MVKSTVEGYNSVGKYQLDINLINEFAEMRGYWTITAYLNSFGYLSSKHIEKRIAKTIQVLYYL